MYVPHGATYGSSSEFIIRNAGFDTYSTTTPFFDQQLFQDAINGKPSAALRVIIQMQPGLNFDTAFVPYIYSPLNGGDTLFPAGLAFDSIISQDTVGTAWRGIFTLDSTHFGSYSEFVDFLNFSYFHYQLYPSCSPEPYEPAYYAAKFYFVPLPDAGCDSCFIPIAKTGGKIRIHCPGCKTFGTESTSYSLIRASGSLGWYDSDNDGLADFPLTRLSDTSSIMLPSVRRNASIAGDTIVATQHGIFHNGDQNTYHDLTYEYYRLSHSPLKYIYFEQMIAHSDTNKFNLIPVSATLTVRPDTCTCPFTYTLNVANIVRDTSIYFIKVPFDSLIAATGGSYHLHSQDEFDLQIKFVVCKNYLVGTNQAAASNYFDSDPIVAMYVTDTSLSHPSYITHAAGILTGDEGYSQLCNPQLSDTCGYWADTLNPDWFYFCGAFGCIHRLYSIRTRNASDWNNQASNLPCDKYMTMNQEIKIGGNSYNVFPFEFRPPIDTASIPNPQFIGDVPVGFQSNLADIEVHFHTFFPGCSPSQDQNVSIPDSVSYHPAGVDSFAYGNFTYSNENMPFALLSNCPPTTYTRLLGAPLYIGDEYFYYDYTLRLYPDCNSQNCKVPVDAQNTLANIHNYGCSATGATLVPNQSSTTNDTLTMPYFIGGTDCIKQDNLPFLTISSFGTTPVSSQHVDFGFSITNQTYGTNCTEAPNVWLYVPTDSFLTNMTITCTSPANECPIVSNDTAINGFFHLGNIKCGNPTQRVCNYILSADYDSCLGAGQHTLPVNYGWYCGQYPNTQPHYPTSLAGDICSNYPSQLITVNEDSVHLSSHIDSIFNQPDTFALCMPYTFEACIESNNGGVNGFLVEINLNDSFILLDTSSVYFFYNNNFDSVIVSVDSISPLQYIADLAPYDSLLNDSTFDLGGGDWICIRYTVTPICGYSNSQMPTVFFGGIAFCGETIPDTLGITPVSWVLHGDSCSPPCADSIQAFISVGQQYACHNSQIQLSASAIDGFPAYTFAWSTLDSTSIIYPVLANSDSVFTVTVTDALGHTATDTITIYVLPYANCCIPSGFDFTDTVNFIDLSQKHASSLSYNIIAGATMVMINDTFTVDTSTFTFDATSVILGPHAVIDVRHGDTLLIEGTQLSSCDSLWNSIQLHDSSNAVIISHDSHIYDGDTAIKAHHGGMVSVTESTFSNNYVGISMRTDKSKLKIEGSVFDCPDTLKAHIQGYTDTHVLLSDAGLITIGNGLMSTNKFVNATKAINTTRTNLNVYNAHIFLDNSLRPTDSATFGIKHVGALGFGGAPAYLLTVGDTTAEQVTIENYGYGSYSKYNTVNHIKNNLYNYNLYGIYQENIRDGQTYDLYNKMVGNKKVAIYWYDVSIGQGYSNINNNEINWGKSDSTLTGILVENIANFHTHVTVVYNNISNVHYGVHLRNMHELDASSNTIEFPQSIDTTSNEYVGILIESGTDNYISGNYVFSPSIPQTGFERVLRGISADQSTSNIIRENICQKMGAGLRVNRNDKPTFLYCNLFDTCQYSVFYNNVGSIGDQGDSLNPWDNVFQGNVSSLKFNGDATAHIQSIWYFRGCDTCAGNTFSTQPSNPSIVLTVDSIDADTYKCEEVEGGGGEGGDKSKSLAKMAGEDESDSSEYQNENRYMDKSTVYKALNNENLLMYMNEPTDQILQDFYDEHSESNIAKLEGVTELSEVGAVDSAIEQNDEIIDTNLIEYNSRIVNEIYFAATQNDTLSLTPQQVSVLESIAYQNPATGGEAVYRARAMLKLYLPDSFSAFRKGRLNFNPSSVVNSLFSVYPIPSKDFFVIRNNGKQDQKIIFLLYDNTGRLVRLKEAKINSEISVSINEIPNGVYQLKITSIESNEVHKLIVVH